MFNRKMERRCFVKWVIGYQRLSDLERGVWLSAKIEKRHRTRNNFNKFLAQATAAKRKEFIDKKCEWFEQQRKQTTTRDCWCSWLLFVRRFKLAKKFLDRGASGIQRNQKFVAMANWKQAMANREIKIYNDNIAELQRRQRDHEESIKKVENDILIAKNVKQHTINQMKSLGKKVMANFITRSTQMQVARGFYNWVDTTNNWNKKRRLLKMCLTYWMKTDTARAFRIWAQHNFRAVEIKLKMELNEKETTRKALERQGA